MTDLRVESLYADGGLLSTAPTRDGGTWAWRAVSERGAVLASASGTVLPAEMGMETIENNLTETLAILYALEAMPSGWTGTLYSDSKNALRRAMTLKGKFGGVPAFIKLRLLAARERVGFFGGVLLGGHPSMKDLARGRIEKKGLPCSIHNKACDRMCKEQSERFWAEKKRRQQSTEQVPTRNHFGL